MANIKEYKTNCPYCQNKIVIKIKKDNSIEISHDDKQIDISEIPNISIEFG